MSSCKPSLERLRLRQCCTGRTFPRMGLRDLLSKFTGTTPQASPQEAELRRVLAAADAARHNHQPEHALEFYQEGLSQAQNEGYLQGQEDFLGQMGSLQTELGH